MTLDLVFVLIVLAFTFALMVWERLPLDIVALLALCALLLGGILSPAEAFRVFSNDAPIAVAGMFVLSAALERTGVIDTIARRLNRIAGKSDWSVLLVTLPIVVVLSAFINNTPVVAVFMPVMMSLAASRGIKPSKLLIPLSFASIFGGLCTLVGTSTNILVSSAAVQLGQPPLRMFELGRIGWPLAAAGLVYLFTVGRRLLPGRETLVSLLPAAKGRQYLTEVVVVAGSPLVGEKLANTPLAGSSDIQLIEVFRAGFPVAVPLDEIVLEAGDRVRLSTVRESVLDIDQLQGVELRPKTGTGLEIAGKQKALVAECVIGPRSGLIGHSIRQADFRRRHGVLVLAVHRQGVNLREDFSSVPLHYGDTLLVEGSEDAVNALRGHRDFLLLLDVPAGAKRRGRQTLAVTVIALVVALSALGVMPIAALALMGAVAVVVAGCLDAEDAYEAIDWRIIFLIFGMLALGMALEKTKGAVLAAHTLILGLGGYGPEVVLGAVVLLASLMTNFLSNNAVAVLLAPVAVKAAVELHVDVRPFLIAVVVGASACFATPIGYQTNTLVYGAGGYRFADFLRVGLPLNLVVCIIAIWLIPKIWAF